ncbi:MAG: glycosyltransferase, partial [Henriciella sp.]
IGRPSLLIPLKIAMNDHQTANAEGLRDLGAAEIFAEDGLTADVLGSQLSRLLPDSTKLQAMAAAAGKAGRLNAASVLADAVENMLNAVAD